jgi:hypothetical protein
MLVYLLLALLLWGSKLHHHNRLLLECILSYFKARSVEILFDITLGGTPIPLKLVVF